MLRRYNLIEVKNDHLLKVVVSRGYGGVIFLVTGVGTNYRS